MTAERIEAVAKAIHEGWSVTPWEQTPEEDKEIDRQCALRAIGAMGREEDDQ